MSRTQAIRITTTRRAVRASLAAAGAATRWLGIVLAGFGGMILIWLLFAVALGWSP